mgnify:CR=1 FL=1
MKTKTLKNGTTVFASISTAVLMLWPAATRAGSEPEAAIEVGDPGAKVERALGQPSGYMKAGDLELYVYERGKVEVRDGVVERVNLISAEAARRRRIERERRQAEREQRQRELKAERRAEGQEWLEKKLDDPRFEAQSAAEKLAFWTRFRRKYPEVDVSDFHQAALEEYRNDVETRRLRERLAALERRAAEAEAAAERAEQEAFDARLRHPTYSPAWPPEVYYYGDGGLRTVPYLAYPPRVIEDDRRRRRGRDSGFRRDRDLRRDTTRTREHTGFRRFKRDHDINDINESPRIAPLLERARLWDRLERN